MVINTFCAKTLLFNILMHIFTDLHEFSAQKKNVQLLRSHKQIQFYFNFSYKLDKNVCLFVKNPVLYYQVKQQKQGGHYEHIF